ncbi:2-hydroxychromene-2-carboxylate isomerase [Alcanivorax hongdengensis A-11-3]|uniref:2-hydroxychromene-2-carboxylate isomerase n=1 Tax=Alcanivorax hongdengensis A-11-3 TaxID=1177179 RepID=L0WFH3_9GAMM|nr:DsbA family protein [Alcanivorax hongdengensis]EKF75449.1 2-hydroxychromene-2-carboxylate isomerase [Alcanivorax hongdengensis A-11-3]
MSLKHRLMPLVAQLITSERLQNLRRHWLEWRRKLRRRPHQAVFYYRIDDPYSVLMAQVLPRFAEHFGITITPRVMLYLDQQMYPAADMLSELAPRDVAALAKLHDLQFPGDWQLPAREVSLAATRCLLRHEHDERFWSLASALADALWRDDHEQLESLLEEHGQQPADQAHLALEARRDQFLNDGHYLTATLHYGGEWYWSIERLDHLARRLEQLGLGGGVWPMSYDKAKTARLDGPAFDRDTAPELEFFFSFRSPYSYLALARTFALADHYQLDLTVRPVLPMVMRGLTVPRAKRFYILKDAAREARLHSVPFGRVCDPVGLGVEHCMALWPFAEKEGRLREWLLTAAAGIWSRGINVASEAGLRRLAEDAGLDWNRARRWLDDDQWRGQAEANRQRMMEAGSWGVPSFLTHGDMIWGQDRMAIVEQTLLDSIDNS